IGSGADFEMPRFSGLGLLRVGPAITPGDYNIDGLVNAADYVPWRKNDGTQQGYNTWRTNFGASTSSPSLSIALVPEPASATLVVLAIAAVCWTDRLRPSRKLSGDGPS
ncbi:MAG TPA: hypothetical protein VGK58_10105, partial [Lacipirellulaceae bacterium]